MNIAIIDYRSGNLHSALKSFQAAASDFKNVRVKITSCYKDVQDADKIVLPGVGSFSFCKSKLLENIDAIPIFFHHLCNAARLPFDTAHARDFLFELGVHARTHASFATRRQSMLCHC